MRFFLTRHGELFPTESGMRSQQKSNKSPLPLAGEG
jgi:hypothetical protein